MNKENFRILFLDDEIYAEKSGGAINPAIIAQKALLAEGYSVDVTDKMSDVIDSYYKKYYHLYLLDIDMGKVADTFDGNGAVVGETLRRLSSISNVIVYSARGKVNDWILAANYHFYAYVHKDWKESKLLEVVNKLFQEVQENAPSLPDFPDKENSGKSLVYYETCQIPLETINSKLNDVILCATLDEMIEKTDAEKPNLMLIALPKFPGITKIEAFLEKIKTLAMRQPSPNLIIAIEASKQDEVLLKLVNLHPFRLLNINSPAIETELTEAIEKALFWYNDQEVFDFPDASRVARKPITPDEIASMRDSDDYEYEEWVSQTVINKMEPNNE
jgi:CheY-like chemotaxis protein